MGERPAVPGLVLDRRMGTGEYGEVWRALDLGAVRAVAVQVGRPARGAGAAAREAAQLRRIDHENVARLRSVVDLPDGRRAIVLDLAPGGDLASLVGQRGPLPAAEAVTVAVALARALDHIHGLGLVHGRLTAHDVHVAADGRPVLTGVGVGSLLARTTAGDLPTYPTPADDVRALGDVLRFAAAGGDAGPLARVIALCLAPDAEARPSPARVASMARDAAPATPVVLDGAPPAEPPAPESTEPRRSSSRRAVLAAAAVLALVAGVVAVAVRPSGVYGDGLDDVRGVVASLAAARARAFGAAAEPALADVDAPGSPALAADTALVRRLRQGGIRLDGLGFDVGSARVVEVSGATATARATVTTSAYVERRADGTVARRVPRGAPRVVRLTLLRTANGWRIVADGPP